MTRVYLHDGLLRECSVALFFYSKKKKQWLDIDITNTDQSSATVKLTPCIPARAR